MCQSRPSTLRQALETSLELESFELASRHRPRMAREAVLEDSELEENQLEQKTMDQLVELVRRAMRDPQQEQRLRDVSDSAARGLFGAGDVVRKVTCNKNAISSPNQVRLFFQVDPCQEMSISQACRAQLGWV